MDDSRHSEADQKLDERVLTQQLVLMSQLTTAPLFASMLVGAMLAWLAFEDHGLIASAGWYVLLMTVTLVRWRVAVAARTQLQAKGDVRFWRVLMLSLAALAGAAWSVSGTWLLPSDPQREVVVAVLFIGSTAAGMGSQAPVRHAYAALLIPFALPYAIYQLLLGPGHMIIGVAFLSYIPVMLVIASRQTAAIEKQIRLALENEALVAELRIERDRTASANTDLAAQVEQQRRSAQHIRALNRDLRQQAAELLATNGDLEGFSYSVSHDLRAPLRAIDGFSALLQEELRRSGQDSADHHLARIRDNVARMAALIDDLLAFARCGRQELQREDLNMTAVVMNVVAQARVANPAYVHEITVDPLPDARGDAALLQQVWMNLVDNAIKYSSKTQLPRVSVSGREEHERVIFEITDNGVGFDSRYSAALFRVFQRLHGMGEFPGTGVGLAIVQRIVTRHGGEVWARSTPGNGATFGFSLPLHELTASDVAASCRG